MNGGLKLLPIGVCAVALILALGYGFTRPQPFIVNNALLNEPRLLPEFELKSTDNITFTREALVGHWSLVFSGYTQCPDVCPTTLSLLAQLHRDWPVASPRPKLVFVTVDPQQDTLAGMRTYLSYFGGDTIGLTGSSTQLNRLLTGIGFYPVANSPARQVSSSETRLLNHSGAVALINPKGQLHALLRAPLTLMQLQTQLRQILAAS